MGLLQVADCLGKIRIKSSQTRLSLLQEKFKDLPIPFDLNTVSSDTVQIRYRFKCGEPILS